MNINQLEYLITAIDRGSFSDAAKSLYISPQAIAKAISELEKELNLELLARSRKGVVPTLYGVLFATKALRVIQDCKDLKHYAESLLLESRKESLIDSSLSFKACRKQPPPLFISPFCFRCYKFNALPYD